ncbi:unnamed protein product, partial [Nesidiocoris tenuis]
MTRQLLIHLIFVMVDQQVTVRLLSRAISRLKGHVRRSIPEVVEDVQIAYCKVCEESPES